MMANQKLHRDRSKEGVFMAAVLPPLVMILLVALIVYLAWREANKEK
jgi:hypothetical protein